MPARQAPFRILAATDLRNTKCEKGVPIWNLKLYSAALRSLSVQGVTELSWWNSGGTQSHTTAVGKLFGDIRLQLQISIACRYVSLNWSRLQQRDEAAC